MEDKAWVCWDCGCKGNKGDGGRKKWVGGESCLLAITENEKKTLVLKK